MQLSYLVTTNELSWPQFVWKIFLLVNFGIFIYEKLSEIAKNGAIFGNFFAYLTLMAHISGARACPVNIFACLESPDKYLALNQKLAQAIPGEESYEQSMWIYT